MHNCLFRFNFSIHKLAINFSLLTKRSIPLNEHRSLSQKKRNAINVHAIISMVWFFCCFSPWTCVVFVFAFWTAIWHTNRVIIFKQSIPKTITILLALSCSRIQRIIFYDFCRTQRAKSYGIFIELCMDFFHSFSSSFIRFVFHFICNAKLDTWSMVWNFQFAHLQVIDVRSLTRKRAHVHSFFDSNVFFNMDFCVWKCFSTKFNWIWSEQWSERNY